MRRPVRLTATVTFFFYCTSAFAAGAGESLTLELGKIFTFFFLTLGPNSVIAPFARNTVTLSAPDRRKVAIITTGISLLAVLIAATIGVHVLGNWGISTGALLVAAGIILFLVALESIRGQYAVARNDEPAATQTGPAGSIRRISFRMAFPHVVSPHGVAVVVLVLSTRPESVPLLPILAMLLGIMLLDLVAMLGAHRIVASAYVAPVMAVLASVLGVLQAALGVQAVLTGIHLAGVY